MGGIGIWIYRKNANLYFRFNNLCTGIFPDDGAASTPMLTETNAEPAKSNQFKLQSRTPGSDTSPGVLFSVSCVSLIYVLYLLFLFQYAYPKFCCALKCKNKANLTS